MITNQIITKALDSIKWSALIEGVSRTAQPIIFVVLARLLSPEDFGVLTIAMIVISFAQMFWDAGLSKALIQTRTSPEKAANVVFWVNISLAIIIYALLFFSAPSIAKFFASPLSCLVLQVLGLQIIIASLSSVQQALFLRQLNFRTLFWIKLLTAFIPGFISIPLAFFGFGVWALVAGVLSGQLINLILLWQKSPWRPQFTFDINLAKPLVGFGLWVMLESFGAWLIIWGDSLIVGRFLGIHDLGVYRTGWMLVAILFGTTLNPFLPVLYPTFSRMQDDLTGMIKTFHRANRIVFALALPMGTGLLLVGPETAELLFGDKWEGLGFVLAILGFMHGASWLVGINTELYRAMGRPDVNSKIIFVALIYYLPAFYITAQISLEIFTLTRLALALLTIPLHVFICVRLIGISYLYICQEGKSIIISTLAMSAVILIIKLTILPAFDYNNILVSVALLILIGCITYFICLWILDRTFIGQTISLIKKAL